MFIWFGYLQINDPDPWLWVPPYLYIATLGLILALKPKARLKYFLLVGLSGYGLWILTFIPDLVHWMQLGMPAITGKMQEKHPYIELVREMGGLLIVMTANLYFYIINQKNYERDINEL
jgi:hypothetical protein